MEVCASPRQHVYLSIFCGPIQMSCCPTPANHDPRRFNVYVKPKPCLSEPLSHAEYLRRKQANNNLPLSKQAALVQTGTGPYIRTDWMLTKPYTPTPTGLASLFYAVPAFPGLAGLTQVDTNTFLYDSPMGRYTVYASQTYNNLAAYGAWNAFTQSKPSTTGLFTTGGAWFSKPQLANHYYDLSGNYTGDPSGTSIDVSPLGNVYGEYIYIDCPVFFLLKSYGIASSNRNAIFDDPDYEDASSPAVSWVLAGSNNGGATYTLLDEQTDQSLNPSQQSTYSLPYNDLNYTRYVLIITKIGTPDEPCTQGANIVALNLYSDTDPLNPGTVCCKNTVLPAVPAVLPGGKAQEAGMTTDSRSAAAGRGTLSHFDNTNHAEWNTTQRRKGLAIKTDEDPSCDTPLTGTQVVPGTGCC